VIDTTGLKVFGAGEWYVRKHGAGRGKRRTWRKLHLCVDEATKDIVAVDLTASGVHERDAVLRRIRDEGRYLWRTSSGATRQSLAENAVSRFKALVGVKLASRELERQQIEVLVKSQVLNRMSALGMPKSERIPVG
jgi:hypothetical protein